MSFSSRYVFFLVLASCLANTLLALFKHEYLSTYLIINIISFLVLTLLFMPSNPEAKKTFNILNIFFFAIFLTIVIIEFTGIM